jgi:hypothetical protein
MDNSGKLSLTGWKAFGPCSISLDTANPLSKAVPGVIKVTVNEGATGECGLQNSGKDQLSVYWSLLIVGSQGSGECQ